MLGRGGLGRLATGSGTARMAGASTSSRWKRGMSNPLSRIATRVAYSQRDNKEPFEDEMEALFPELGKIRKT